MTELTTQSTLEIGQRSERGVIEHLLIVGGYRWSTQSGSWTYREGEENRAALAELRSGLGKQPGDMARVHKHVVPYLPEEDYEDRWYYLTATLFGLYPKHRTDWSTGKAFGQLRKESESMEARFIALLNAHPDDLDDHLRHTVSLLSSNEQPFDWFRFFEDLVYWDHPERLVQLKWARDFYRVNLPDKTSGAADSGEADGVEQEEDRE
jgi:CRISPR system Cascade subunit CasB